MQAVAGLIALGAIAALVFKLVRFVVLLVIRMIKPAIVVPPAG